MGHPPRQNSCRALASVASTVTEPGAADARHMDAEAERVADLVHRRGQRALERRDAADLLFLLAVAFGGRRIRRDGQERRIEALDTRTHARVVPRERSSRPWPQD